MARAGSDRVDSVVMTAHGNVSMDTAPAHPIVEVYLTCFVQARRGLAAQGWEVTQNGQKCIEQGNQ